MAINRSNIAKQLLPGLNAVFGVEYGDVNDEQVSLYEVENSDRSFEEEVLFTGFGSAPIKQEGSAVQFDTAQESYTARYNHETVALAFSVTEEAMEDNLYDTFSKVRARGLARAMANTKQVKAADLFNNGFSAGDDAIGDGAAFFSAAHPTIGNGNQSNLAAAADLSEAALETILTDIQLIKDDRGILVGAGAKSLHIPPHLQFIAEKVLMSPGTTTGAFAKNDINAVRALGSIPGGYFVNRRFTDINGYFVKTDVPNGAKMFVRTPLQTKMEEDFDTGNLRFKARERYSFGVSDWRSYFGSIGA
jgi:hypothetical protein|tara:strand:- start:94 stop:1008 length:915 start_codon:yes stop_codon:yes gene_type:complete